VKPLSQVLSIATMFTINAFRSWVVYFALAIFPASFFILLTLLGGTSLGQHALYGFIVSISANAGVVALPQKVVFYKYTRKLQDVFVSAPISPFVYMSGLALSRLAWSAPGFVVFAGILLGCGFMRIGALPSLCVVVVASWIVGSALGFTLGTHVANPHLISSIANMLGMFLVVFPPVLYPMELLPEGVRWVTALIPTASAAELLRQAGGVSRSGVHPVYMWCILGAWTLFCVTAVMCRSRWQDP